MNFVTKALTVATLALGITAAAQAVTVIPVSAVGSSSFPGYADTNAIDQGPGAATTDWASFGEGNDSFLNLDLGAVYSLASATVSDRVTSGGGNGGFVGGVTDFTSSFSLTVYTDSSFTTTAGAPLVFLKSAPVAPTSPADFTTVHQLGGLTGQYIRYSVLASGASNNPGLSNISFNTVPEPATWFLLIAGFGMVGVAARRRGAAIA